MKRHTLFTTIAAIGVAASAPALAGPGGGNGGGRGGGLGAGINAGAGMRGSADINRGMGTTIRDSARINSQGAVNADPRAIERANSNSALSGEAVTGTRIPESATRVRGHTDTHTARTGSGLTAMNGSKLTGVTSGMTVVDGSGATIGTVTGVTTKGNGSTRTVQVTLTDGQIITLAPNSLTLDGDVLTTSSLTSNVQSQGAAHANINGLVHASPNSALASAGVTSLTGLTTGLTVNDSGGTLVGTVDQVITNRTGAVVAVRVALDGGGTATIPATSLSMDGSTVVTSSTQF